MLSNALLVFAPAKAVHGVDGILGPLLICTSDGVQEVSHEGIPEPGNPSGPHCPFCTLAKSFVLTLPPVPWEFLPPTQNVLRVGWNPRLAAVSQLRLGGIGSRAPPAFT
jgi:hypothetical protein